MRKYHGMVFVSNSPEHADFVVKWRSDYMGLGYYWTGLEHDHGLSVWYWIGKTNRDVVNNIKRTERYGTVKYTPSKRSVLKRYFR